MATRSPSAVAPPNPELKARGANRSTKVAQKLKVLPDQPDPATQSRVQLQEDPKSPLVEVPPGEATADEAAAEGDDEEFESDSEELQDIEDVEVYNAIAQIPAGTARNDALRLTKRKAKELPRVTAFCTASEYRMDDLMKFFNARRQMNHTNARMIDEAIYTPYLYGKRIAPPPPEAKDAQPATGDLLGIPELRGAESDADGATGMTTDVEASAPGQKVKRKTRFDKSGDPGIDSEVYIFKYGAVVIWGMSEDEERRFLASLKRFEVEKLGPTDVEKEDLNFYYADHYSRIYNDVITLRRGSSYMTKLALSHALAQSAKISVFEELITATIEQTKDLPETIAGTGKIGIPHGEIMRQIGQLFILRMSLSNVGSVLDSPDVFWSYPDLQPLYDAARSYLEIPQRINILNTRVEVLQDMLQLLKESANSRHSEQLETIVIVLIVIEILLGVITVLVDLFSSAA